MPSADTLNRVKKVIRACLKVGDNVVLEDQMPLLGGEYDMDSLDILMIVTELETEFGVKIDEGSMGAAAFKDITTLSAYLETLSRTPRVPDAP